MYSNIVLNLFNNPKNAGRISKPDGIADLYNEDETAHVEFSLRIETGIITEAKFRAQANPYIIAICSTITQMLKGKMVSMVFIDPYSIKTELGDEQPVDIDFCIDCVKLAIQDYKEKLEKENKQNKKNNKEVVLETSAEQDMPTEVENNTEDVKKDTDEDDDFDFSDFFDEEDF